MSATFAPPARLRLAGSRIAVGVAALLRQLERLPPDARRLLVALAPAAFVLGASLALGPIAQPESYHHFHDGRGLLGIPNLLNVLSNLPFAIVGALGIRWLRSGTHGLPDHLRLCYTTMLAGVALTSVGSAYYHWAPDSATLIWDRLPMAIAFMGLFSGFLTERLRLGAATSIALLAGLVGYGVASVLYWAAFDDLRLYAVAQFYPIVAIPLVLWLTRAPYTHASGWLVAIGVYVAAKVLEEGDGVLYAMGGLVSGHTLKHLAAAGGAWWLYRMLRHRQSLP